MSGLGLGSVDQLVPSHDSINVKVELKSLTRSLPTATQSVDLTHETLMSWLKLVLGLGASTTDHVVPSQDSTSVCSIWPFAYCPTATQSLTFTQEMPESSLKVVLGSGLGSTDQVVPSHLSMRVNVPTEPTATQSVALKHDTFESSSFGPGFGLGERDHSDPSHVSMSV
jgi:hypothetical protein